MLHELALSTRRNGHTYLTWSELKNAAFYMLQQTGSNLQLSQKCATIISS